MAESWFPHRTRVTTHSSIRQYTELGHLATWHRNASTQSMFLHVSPRFGWTMLNAHNAWTTHGQRGRQLCFIAATCGNNLPAPRSRCCCCVVILWRSGHMAMARVKHGQTGAQGCATNPYKVQGCLKSKSDQKTCQSKVGGQEMSREPRTGFHG